MDPAECQLRARTPRRARQAFQQTTPWQRNLGKEVPSTPAACRGPLPQDLADDLIAWLGADVVLLLPA